LGDAAAARRRYLEALEANPDDHWCRGHLAQLECEMGNDERSVALYQYILEREPGSTWAMVELAQVLSISDIDAAKALCDRALQEDPSYPWAWAQLGVLARIEGKLEESRSRLQRALESSPSSTWILHELADSCRLMGRSQEAYAHLEHARNIDPFDAGTYGYIADMLRREGRPREAIANLNKALEFDPDYNWAWRELAELQALAGEHERAEQAYREACRLVPDDPTNDGLLAFLKRCAGQQEEAVPLLERAVARQPDYLWAWRELIEQLLAAGQHQAARDRAIAALEHLPEHAALHALHAESLRQLGRRGEARDAVALALQRDERVAQFWALSAELAHDIDAERAVAHARRALELDDRDDYRLLLAQLELAAGNETSTRELLAELLRNEQAPALAWDLAAELAERADSHEQALALSKNGLAAHPESVALLLRRKRLALEHGLEAPELHELHELLGAEQALPWRDLALLLARGNEALAARRAATRALQQIDDDPDEAAGAWLLQAEVELLLGDAPAARCALERSIAHDPQLLPARLLAALLADQADDDEAADAHLRVLGELVDHDHVADGERQVLLRQLALLRERRDDHDGADRCWQRLDVEGDPELLLDFARARQRRGDDHQARLALETHLDARELHVDDAERQRLLTELCTILVRQEGATKAATYLRRRSQRLSPSNRLLWAQLDLASREPQAVHAADERLRDLIAEFSSAPDGDEHLLRAARIMHARALQLQARHVEAEGELRELLAEHRADQEATVLLAEVLAAQERLGEAAAVLQNPELGRPASRERALLAALLLLEHAEHVHEALAFLARHNPDPSQSALLALLQRAWPSWCEHSATTAIDPSVTAQLPAFPRLARRLADALARRGEAALAAAVLDAIAGKLRGTGAVRWARTLERDAARLARERGDRAEARRRARRARAPLCWLRYWW